MRYFVADLHLGHQKVAEHRGFASCDAHDDAVMNSLADIPYERGDTLWILGDLTAGGRGAEELALKRLDHGIDTDVDLRIIAGNHDSCHPMFRDAHERAGVFLEHVDSVSPFARTRLAGLGKRSVLLSHFPYVGDHTDVDRATQYRLRDEGMWIIHGHTHADAVYRPDVHPRQLCVSWDAVGQPVPEVALVRQIIAAEEVAGDVPAPRGQLDVVEAAAIALYGEQRPYKDWDDAPVTSQVETRREAIVVLRSAGLLSDADMDALGGAA